MSILLLAIKRLKRLVLIHEYIIPRAVLKKFSAFYRYVLVTGLRLMNPTGVGFVGCVVLVDVVLLGLGVVTVVVADVVAVVGGWAVFLGVVGLGTVEVMVGLTVNGVVLVVNVKIMGGGAVAFEVAVGEVGMMGDG